MCPWIAPQSDCSVVIHCDVLQKKGKVGVIGMVPKPPESPPPGWTAKSADIIAQCKAGLDMLEANTGDTSEDTPLLSINVLII